MGEVGSRVLMCFLRPYASVPGSAYGRARSPDGSSWASYNGPMLDVGWQVADGDVLWGVAHDPAGEFEVVRYRLREPF